MGYRVPSFPSKNVSSSGVYSPSNTAIGIPLYGKKPAKVVPFPEECAQSQSNFDYFRTLGRMICSMSKVAIFVYFLYLKNQWENSVTSLGFASMVFDLQEALKRAP